MSVIVPVINPKDGDRSTVTFTDPPIVARTVSLLSGMTPQTLADSDATSVELGMTFRSSVATTVLGARFYKGATSDGGTHVANLWKIDGTKLASATFVGETATGWQEVRFSAPVPIVADTDYVVSALSPQGHYPSTSYGLQATITSGILSTHGPGTYKYGGGFPASSWQATNYFVDVIAANAAPPPPPPPDGTASSVTQYGITWTFDKAYPVGQFVTGDWWVIGPVTVVSVSPAPSVAPPNEINDLGTDRWGDTGLVDDKTRRNGSSVLLDATSHLSGFDSRSKLYRANLSINYPYQLAVNRSLVSTISNVVVPQRVIYADIMWEPETSRPSVLKTAAILTCLPTKPPDDAFRPPYCGTEKPIFRTSNLHWDRLLNLTPPSITPMPTLDQFARYLQRPWLDNCEGSYEMFWLFPVDNQAWYGREVARITGMAALMLHTAATQTQKTPLLYGLVQYGIDLMQICKMGASFNAGGGITSGRKFPVIFAGWMLNDPTFATASQNAILQEDTQTYWGKGWCGQKALWQMVTNQSPLGIAYPFMEKPPNQWDTWDQNSEDYRLCCNAKGWIAQTLAVLLMSGKALWNHNAYFEVVEDWMRPTDIYAANRKGYPRPADETTTWDPFVTAFWTAHRQNVPTQPDGTTDLKWDVYSSSTMKWVPNPKPT